MSTPSFKHKGKLYGLLSGSICVGIYILLYAYQPELLFRYAAVLSSAVILFFMTAVAVHTKKNAVPPLLFRDLLQAVFVVCVLSVACLVGFQYLLYNFIDPDFGELTRTQMLEQLQAQYEITVDEQLKQQLAQEIEQTKTADVEAGILTSLARFAVFTVPGFLIGLVISLLVVYLPIKNKYQREV